MVKRRKRQAGIDPYAPEEQPICKQIDLGEVDNFHFDFQFDINSPANIPAVVAAVLTDLPQPILQTPLVEDPNGILEMVNNADISSGIMDQQEVVYYGSDGSESVHSELNVDFPMGEPEPQNSGHTLNAELTCTDRLDEPVSCDMQSKEQ